MNNRLEKYLRERSEDPDDTPNKDLVDKIKKIAKEKGVELTDVKHGEKVHKRLAQFVMNITKDIHEAGKKDGRDLPDIVQDMTGTALLLVDASLYAAKNMGAPQEFVDDLIQVYLIGLSGCIRSLTDKEFTYEF